MERSIILPQLHASVADTTVNETMHPGRSHSKHPRSLLCCEQQQIPVY